MLHYTGDIVQREHDQVDEKEVGVFVCVSHHSICFARKMGSHGKALGDTCISDDPVHCLFEGL
jgi:hypothetical protein